MDKISLILKHFDKSALLTIKNQKYKKLLSSLFLWLIDADGVKNDITTNYLQIEKIKSAKIICRDNHAVLSGMEELQFLLSEFTKLDFTPVKKDKGILSKNEVVAKLKGNVSTILSYERTILNILQRMSGIATQTNHLINTIDQRPTTNDQSPYIAATRKTLWGIIDKKAVSIGGGLTHRLNLSDGILIKDNHLAMTNIEDIIKKASILNKTELIEIEIESEQQALQTIKTFQQIKTGNYLAIMLDNFTPSQAKNTINSLKKEFDLSSIIIEASGGIDEKNILEWSRTGVDIVSLGSLTHSSKASNFSLEI